MIVTYYGKQFFKIQIGDSVIAYNPVGKNSKIKTARFGADIVLSSLRNEDFNGSDQCAHGEKDPFIVRGPGEYEVNGVFIKGFGVPATYRGEHKINTIYSVVFDGINLCFLGFLQNSEMLSREIKEGLGEIDVLFVPTSGGDTLSPSDAYKFAIALETKVIIPMEYEERDGNFDLFTKESAAENVEILEKFTFKKKDLDDKEGHIIALKSA